MSAYKDAPEKYRVVEVGDQFQPEMHYQCRAGFRWVPLLANGYWADPDCFSHASLDEPMAQSLMTKDEAARAIWLGQKINCGIAA